MNKTSFSIIYMGQDIQIYPEDDTQVNAYNDGLRTYLRTYVNLTFRKPSDDKSFDVISVSAKLNFHQPQFTLSEIHIPAGISVIDKENKTGLVLNFPLDEKAISAIENNRNGDVGFSIDFNFSILLRNHYSVAGNSATSNMESRIAGEKLQFNISKSKWVEKIHPKLGLPGLKLFEIPMSHKTLNEAYDHIISEFNKAEYYFNHQDYNKCIAHCRSTMDMLNVNLKNLKNGITSTTAFKWLEKVEKATFTWIDEISKSNSAIASKAHHANSREFTRNEAQSIYLVTLGLMNFVGNINKN